jgi:hypothetical protein
LSIAGARQLKGPLREFEDFGVGGQGVSVCVDHAKIFGALGDHSGFLWPSRAYAEQPIHRRKTVPSGTEEISVANSGVTANELQRDGIVG